MATEQWWAGRGSASEQVQYASLVQFPSLGGRQTPSFFELFSWLREGVLLDFQRSPRALKLELFTA